MKKVFVSFLVGASVGAIVCYVVLDSDSVIKSDSEGVALGHRPGKERVVGGTQDPLLTSLGIADLFGEQKGDFSDTFDRIMGMPQDSDRMLALLMLMKMWAREDLHGAMEFANALESPMERSGFLAECYRYWCSIDPDAALASLKAIEDSVEKSGMVRSIIYGIAATQPEVALSLASASDFELGELHLVFHKVFEGWAESDPEAAALKVMQIEGAARQSGISALARGWASRDFEAALQWSTSLPEIHRDAAMFEVVSELIDVDPEEASQRLGDIPSGPGKAQLISRLAGKWAPTDPEAAKEWVTTALAGESGKEEALAHFSQGLLEGDPAEASTMLEVLPYGGPRDYFIGRLAESWVQTNSADTLRWAETLDGPDRKLAMEGLSRGWAMKDPSSAAEYAEELTDPEEKAALVGMVALQWGATDPEAAISWISELDGALQPDAQKALVSSWASRDREAAGNHAREFGDAATRDQLIHTHVRTVIASDPRGAASYLETIEEGPARSKAAGHLASSWAHRDSIEASRWVASLSHEEGRDNAIVGLSYAVKEADPQGAFQWVRQLEDESLRQKWYPQIFESWTKTVGEETALRNANLTNEERILLGLSEE